MTTYNLHNMAKINISPIYWTAMLSYIGILKNNFKSTRNEYKEIFSSKNIFICLYSYILNQNVSISKIAIYHPPRPCWPRKKVHISELSGQIFTNLPRMCGKKILAKTKQKIYRTERKFIKLREEAKKPVSWHHDGDPFKDINYIFSLRAAFMECISFI